MEERGGEEGGGEEQGEQGRGGEGGGAGEVEEAEGGTMGLEINSSAPPLRLLWQWGGGYRVEGWSCGHRDPWWLWW